MTPFVFTWILWAIVTTPNPNVNSFVVLDEFPEKSDCMETAKQLGVAIVRDLQQQQISGIASITTACIVTAAGKETARDFEKPKRHLKTEPIG